MRKREFYLQDDQSNKYWTIEVEGDSVITTNGRMGAKPRETRAAFGTSDLALREAEKPFWCLRVTRAPKRPASRAASGAVRAARPASA